MNTLDTRLADATFIAQKALEDINKHIPEKYVLDTYEKDRAVSALKEVNSDEFLTTAILALRDIATPHIRLVNGDILAGLNKQYEIEIATQAIYDIKNKFNI